MSVKFSHTLNARKLFRLTFSEPVIWLSGPKNSQQAVNWVTLHLQETQPGDILVLEAASASTGILSSARERQVAAVLLLGMPDIQNLDSPLGLSIAFTSEILDLRFAQQNLLMVLVNQRAALMERGTRVHAELAQLAAEGEGLPTLAQVMSGISGKGILVQDKRLQILAEHPGVEIQSDWQDLLLFLKSPDNLPESFRDRKEAGRNAHSLLQELPAGYARILIPITVGEVARGYLSVMGLADELDALDQMVAEQGSLVCAVEMARNKAVRETEKRLKGNLLTALLQENLSPRDALLWVQAMGLDLEKSHVAVRFVWDGPMPPSRRRLETLVNGELAHHGLKAIVSPVGSEVVCFMETSIAGKRPESVLDFAQAVLDQELIEYPQIAARCGVGTPALDLSEWRNSFRQAGQALDMSRRLAERRPLYFPDLSVYRLLLQIEYNPELIAFQEETLGALLSYDGGEELISTLEAYFEHNGNLSQTAEALFIHRNTLIYRMERIAAITNLDLDDPETRLAVQLALHIHRMTGTLRG